MLTNLFEFFFCPAHGVFWQAGPCASAVVVQVWTMVRNLVRR